MSDCDTLSGFGPVCGRCCVNISCMELSILAWFAATSAGLRGKNYEREFEKSVCAGTEVNLLSTELIDKGAFCDEDMVPESRFAIFSAEKAGAGAGACGSIPPRIVEIDSAENCSGVDSGGGLCAAAAGGASIGGVASV